LEEVEYPVMNSSKADAQFVNPVAQEVRIEPDVFASKDQEMLQDLIRAAVNEASRRVDDELANQMKSIAGGIPGMPGLKIPGLF
jgi:DNA-binding protein YbaB